IRMSEIINIKSSQSLLLREVEKCIDEGSRISNLTKRPISDGPFKDYLIAASFFGNIIIPSEVYHDIRCMVRELYVSKKRVTMLGALQDDMSLKGLIEYARTLKKTNKIISNTIYSLRFFETRKDVINAKVDYLYELKYCLLLISDLINRSKGVNRHRRREDFLEYCALCWRLVNKNNSILYSHTEHYSRFYCLVHHPKKSDLNYHKAKGALLAAIKRLNINVITVSPNKYGPYELYAATGRIVEKIKLPDFYKRLNGNSWYDSARCILEISKHYYPHANKVLINIAIDNLSSWKDWFYAVIKALDPSGVDSSNWNNVNVDWNGVSDNQAVTNGLVGERVLLNILHRYECVSFISDLHRTFPRPRGPQKGTVKKNNELRERITVLANRQMAEDFKINAAKIAKEMMLSRQRVNVILRELGLRK
ncbi:hypothetical protein ACF8QD_05155, partial [Aeromonas media]|uniref:hypothetical protein n=1 Tax=Aeromonas media TaxID=651 RepID=UPI00370B21F6